MQSVEVDDDSVVLELSVSLRAEGARPAAPQHIYQVFTVDDAQIVDVRAIPTTPAPGPGRERHRSTRQATGVGSGVVQDTRVMDLSDGRELAWLELGDPAGKPVLGFHGTPGSRFQLVVDEQPVRMAGVRLISVDRPGYGHSTYKPGRTLAEWPDDVRELADHLGIERFGVVGISGGGPHSLACAALMPDRVAVAGVLSGVSPLAAPGAEEGMMRANVLITKMGRRSTWPLEAVFGLMTRVQRRWPESTLRMMTKQMPGPDAEIVSRPEVRHMFLQEARRAAATSAKASAQDFQVFSRDWGFRLEEIRVPVHLWQGDADRNVPAAHARLLAAAIPGADLHEIEGGGHLATLDRSGEIFSTLAALI
ncbi:MAG TPA: alpha/beta hydrolase [Acidimicrobiales bacterium]|nr:alpha/beta hydrolase [Acidimicrobiales bacterium]